MKVREDGELDKSEVRALLDAMEAIGIPLLDFESGGPVTEAALQQSTGSGDGNGEDTKSDAHAAFDYQWPDSRSRTSF